MTTLTQQALQEVLSYDVETGIFTRLSTNQALQGESLSDPYLRIRVCGKSYLAHRLAWLYVYGEFPEGFLDHIDRNPRNNRIKNLRICGPTENAQNVGPKRSNRSGTKVPGVSFCFTYKKYRVTLQPNGKQLFGGYFETLEAAEERCIELRKIHMPFYVVEGV